MRNDKKVTSTMLQIFANSLCNDINIPQIKIVLFGKQPATNHSKTMGIYVNKNEQKHIRIYQYTAKRFKQIATKTAFDILLHELNHYFDYEIIGLTRSIHTTGFFKRIMNLKNILLEK